MTKIYLNKLAKSMRLSASISTGKSALFRDI